jgi:hypothetical protein
MALQADLDPISVRKAEIRSTQQAYVRVSGLARKYRRGTGVQGH